MSTNVPRQTPFLRAQRHFPQDSQALAVELDKSYIDIANAVNTRTIGVYPKNFSVVTGNSWYLTGSNQRQQTLRQVYTFTSAGSIPHNINTQSISGFTFISGSFTDGTNFYPLPYVAIVAANQVQVVITPTNIVITAGGGAPTIASGVIVLEWLSQT